MSLTDSQRLIKYGFIQDGARGKYKWDPKKKYYVPATPEQKYDDGDAYEEYHEESPVLPKLFNSGPDDYIATGYPESTKNYHLVYESTSASIEEVYYWLMDYLKIDSGFPIFEKIVDIFSASEQSAFWGQAQARLGIQQDRVTQYMATIGKMVKDLFQLVRELRIIEERLDIYEKAPKSKSADVTLKGMYVDLVEGGAKNPGSVYGIAQQVGFTILPDLFFNTHIYSESGVDSKISAMAWNEQVKNVLRRKLYAFINWKQKTEAEMKNRFSFTLKYLRQHWDVIKMYMAWVKPYLRNIKRMQMHEKHIQDVDIISAFESAVTEIETLAYKPARGGIHPCVLLSINCVTSPEMSYHQEGYAHKGPLHVGKIEFHLRAYGWTKDEIENYKRMKNDEDFDLIKSIDESISAAMDALGDDLNRYLQQAGENLEKFGIETSSTEKEKPNFLKETLDPFLSIFSGIKEMLGSFKGITGSFKNPKAVQGQKLASAAAKISVAKENVIYPMYLCYKNFKKGHQMIGW